jgi:uncharacterized protein YndB with AHSA1/START domain
VSASRYVGAPPDVVFGLVTDLDRLPEWNDLITGLAQRPARLKPGAEWVVTISMKGVRWRSRSVVLEHDPVRRRFSHRSKRDDRNPSHSFWTWQVDPEGEGSRLTLSWDFRYETPLRRLFVRRLRSAQIVREAPASLAALAALAEREAARR